MTGKKYWTAEEHLPISSNIYFNIVYMGGLRAKTMLAASVSIISSVRVALRTGHTT